MPVTRQQVEQLLNVDEPDYQAAAKLGPAALPHLAALAQQGRPGLAAKSIYLASLIGGEGLIPILDAASLRDDPVFRVVATAGLRHLSSQQFSDAISNRLTDIALRLLTDPDEGVRRRAVEALPQGFNAKLADRLSQLADSLGEGGPKDHVVQALRKVGR